MKKLLLLFVFSVIYFGTQLSAQLSIRFGPEVGLQLASSSIKDDTLKVKKSKEMTSFWEEV